MGVVILYKYKENQISFSDFGQPVGMKMSAENRWVKKAETIPWGEIEQRYEKLFTNRKGNVAKPLRLALGAYWSVIIKVQTQNTQKEIE
jgi:hypothetical protein